MTLKVTAEEVLAILEAGRYRVQNEEVFFGPSQESTVKNTRLYRPDDLDALRSLTHNGHAPKTSVVDGTTQSVAYEMARESASPLALLNFASARNPGGGFLNGAKAQEEDICRCSGLYPCLLKCREYYEVNREQQSLLYTDYAIYSPNVPFFKTRSTGELLREPFFVSVITAPAPNSRPFLDVHPGQTGHLERTFVRRWENVLCIARDQGIHRLLLGAWGCGAFGGDPKMAAATAKVAIDSKGANLDQIVFAIPGSGRQSKTNFNAFHAEFSLTHPLK